MSKIIAEINNEIKTAKKYMTESYQFTNTYYRDGYIQGLVKAKKLIKGEKQPEFIITERNT